MEPVIETPRLILREMSLDDLDFVASMLADPQVMRFYPKCYSRDEAETWVRRQMQRYRTDGHGLWLAIDKPHGKPVGQVGLAMQQVEGEFLPEVGYLIHAPFWKRGFASEAAAATRDHAFHTLGKERVISLVRPVNIPSQRVALKIGMKPVQITMHADLEHIVFSLSRTGGPD